MPFEDIEHSLYPDAHHKLVYRFFVVFSRFEYALKRAGYRIGNGDGVKPDWTKFASEYIAICIPSADPKMRDVAAYFSLNPPRRLIHDDNGKMAWSEPQKRTNEPELIWLLEKVRNVRNNLFHGGKYPYNSNIDEPARDSTLLEHTLTIIEASCKFNKDVNRFMRSPD